MRCWTGLKMRLCLMGLRCVVRHRLDPLLPKPKRNGEKPVCANGAACRKASRWRHGQPRCQAHTHQTQTRMQARTQAQTQTKAHRIKLHPMPVQCLAAWPSPAQTCQAMRWLRRPTPYARRCSGPGPWQSGCAICGWHCKPPANGLYWRLTLPGRQCFRPCACQRGSPLNLKIFLRVFP